MSTTGPPPAAPPSLKMTPSHKALWGLVVFLLLAKLVSILAHIPFHTSGQQALFAWKSVAFFIALTLLGAGFAHVVGFPGMWEQRFRVRQKIWIPIAIGLVLGTALLFTGRAAGFSRLYALATKAPPVHLPLGDLVLFQVFAGSCAAILYNLFAVAFVVWFVGTLLLARRWPSPTFWVLAVVVSFAEPVVIASQQHWALFHVAPISAALVGLLALYYVLDLTAAILLRRFGFTAALVMRLSAVVVWHIIGRH